MTQKGSDNVELSVYSVMNGGWMIDMPRAAAESVIDHWLLIEEDNQESNFIRIKGVVENKQGRKRDIMLVMRKQCITGMDISEIIQT